MMKQFIVKKIVCTKQKIKTTVTDLVSPFHINYSFFFSTIAKML